MYSVFILVLIIFYTTSVKSDFTLTPADTFVEFKKFNETKYEITYRHGKFKLF